MLLLRFFLLVLHIHLVVLGCLCYDYKVVTASFSITNIQVQAQVRAVLIQNGCFIGSKYTRTRQRIDTIISIRGGKSDGTMSNVVEEITIAPQVEAEPIRDDGSEMREAVMIKEKKQKKKKKRKKKVQILVSQSKSITTAEKVKNKEENNSAEEKDTIFKHAQQHERTIQEKKKKKRKTNSSSSSDGKIGGGKNGECIRRIKHEWKDIVKLGIGYDWITQQTITIKGRSPTEQNEMNNNDHFYNYNYIRLGPLHNNLLHWHFSIRGPSHSDYERGIYHGRIILPKDYPGSPPRVQVLTPSGRFVTGEDICLSASAFHPETWRYDSYHQ